jgi:hypothetical protein
MFSGVILRTDIARRGRQIATAPRAAILAASKSSLFASETRRDKLAAIDESERHSGVNPSPSAIIRCDRMTHARLNDSRESLVRVFLRATKVAARHARESGVNPRPREPSPPQRLVGSPQAVSKLHGTRRSAVASIKAEARPTRSQRPANHQGSSEGWRDDAQADC